MNKKDYNTPEREQELRQLRQKLLRFLDIKEREVLARRGARGAKGKPPQETPPKKD